MGYKSIRFKHISDHLKHIQWLHYQRHVHNSDQDPNISLTVAVLLIFLAIQESLTFTWNYIDHYKKPLALNILSKLHFIKITKQHNGLYFFRTNCILSTLGKRYIKYAFPDYVNLPKLSFKDKCKIILKYILSLEETISIFLLISIFLIFLTKWIIFFVALDIVAIVITFLTKETIIHNRFSLTFFENSLLAELNKSIQSKMFQNKGHLSKKDCVGFLSRNQISSYCTQKELRQLLYVLDNNLFGDR